MWGFTLTTATGTTITSTQLGARFTAPVDLPAAQRRIDDIEVPGRAGTLTRLLGWNDTTLTLPLAINLAPGLDTYRRLVTAFDTATRIELSAEPGCFRHLKYADVSPLRRELSGWGMLTVSCCCAPFTYLTSGLTPITTSGPTTLTNPGLLPADPIITITGTGRLTLTVGAVPFTVSSPAGTLTVDAARMLCHVAGKAQTDALIGDFPSLAPGPNQIIPGPGISQLVITPGWRNP